MCPNIAYVFRTTSLPNVRKIPTNFGHGHRPLDLKSAILARRRAIKLGNVTITFRPTAASKLFWAGRPAMRVVQALYWLRDLLAREGESDQIKRKLAKFFETPTVGPALKGDLAAGVTALPTWMWIFLKPLVEGGAGDQHRHNADDGHPPRTNDVDADDDQPRAARSRRKPLSTGTAKPAKRRAAKT